MFFFLNTLKTKTYRVLWAQVRKGVGQLHDAYAQLLYIQPYRPKPWKKILGAHFTTVYRTSWPLRIRPGISNRLSWTKHIQAIDLEIGEGNP